MGVRQWLGLLKTPSAPARGLTLPPLDQRTFEAYAAAAFNWHGPSKYYLHPTQSGRDAMFREFKHDEPERFRAFMKEIYPHALAFDNVAALKLKSLEGIGTDLGR